MFKENGVSLEDMTQMVKTEIEVMRVLDSPYVVKLHDSFQVGEGGEEGKKGRVGEGREEEGRDGREGGWGSRDVFFFFFFFFNLIFFSF